MEEEKKVQYDWEANVKINIQVLRAVGLWPKTTYALNWYMVHALVVQTMFLIMHIVFQTVYIYFIRSQIEVVVGSVYVLLVETILIFKIYSVVTNMGLLKQLLEVFKTDMFQPKNSVQLEAIAVNVFGWKALYLSMSFASIGVNIFWAIYPFLDSSGSDDRRLPFQAWYPFDTKHSPVYQITYIYQVASVCFITIVHVSVDALVAAISTFNISQFDILGDNIRNVNQGGDATENVVNCVKHHRAILSHADQSNQLLNGIILAQLFVSAFSIGVSMFQLTLVEPMSNEFYSLAVYIVVITIQIFMYCWVGNEVEIKSGNSAYAVFESDWTDFSEDLKKKLLFFSMILQTPVRLSAFKVFYLNLESFMKIIKTAWSYFTLLNQLTSD